MKEQLIPWVVARDYSRILRDKATDLRETPPHFQPGAEAVDDTTVSALQGVYESDLGRLDRIEKKGQAALVAAGVAVGLITIVLTSLRDSHGAVPFWVAILLLLAGAACFFLSAMSAYEASTVGGVDLQWADSIVQESKEGLSVKHTSRRARAESLYLSIQINNLRCLERQNWVDAAFKGMRNGVVLALLGSALLVLALAVGVPNGGAGTTVNPNSPAAQVPASPRERRSSGCGREHRFSCPREQGVRP